MTDIVTKETNHGTIIVDACDADFLDSASVSAATGRYPYAQNYLGRDGVKLVREYTHRLVMGRVMGRALSSGEQVDHINGNGLDNRRANLRVATVTQNHGNARLSKANTSGFKGVHWHKSSGKWLAHIRRDKKLFHLGSFTDPAAAHEAYMDAARQHFGEFANDGKGGAK